MTLQNEIENFIQNSKVMSVVLERYTVGYSPSGTKELIDGFINELSTLIQDREKKAWEDGYAYKLTGFKEFRDKEYLKEEK